jgi:hypothetical protein
MTPNEYVQAFDKALTDLESKIHERDILNAQIAGLRETLRVLSRTTLTKDRMEAYTRLMDMVDYATPTLANSIRTVLAKAYPNGMTAVEIRNVLEDIGFNFDDFSNSLSACHATLKRMVTDEEVNLEMRKDGKAAYRRILKLTPPLKATPPPQTPVSVAELIKRAARAKAQKDTPAFDTLEGIIGKLGDMK